MASVSFHIANLLEKVCLPFVRLLLVLEDGYVSEPFIDNIDYLAPIGKSDHSVLNIHFCAQVRKTTKVDKYNYAKADFDGLRKSCGKTYLAHSAATLKACGPTSKKNFKIELYSSFLNKRILTL